MKDLRKNSTPRLKLNPEAKAKENQFDIVMLAETQDHLFLLNKALSRYTESSDRLGTYYVPTRGSLRIFRF